jgi:predicted metal-dependent peptidase
MLYWDSYVERDELYTQDKLDSFEKNTNPTGGGGTDVRCVIKYMRDKKITPQAVVVFTDGYLPDWGVWPCPVLWCIVNNPNARPTVGKVLHVNTNEM